MWGGGRLYSRYFCIVLCAFALHAWGQRLLVCHVRILVISPLYMCVLPTVLLVAHTRTNEFPTGLLTLLTFCPLSHQSCSYLAIYIKKSGDHACIYNHRQLLNFTCWHATYIRGLECRLDSVEKRWGFFLALLSNSSVCVCVCVCVCVLSKPSTVATLNFYAT